MSYSGDAAEQIMRISLEGTEAALKLTGEGAKQIAELLYAVLRDQKRTKGKTRLVNLLRSGKELKVYAVKDENLKLFCTEAKKYGILYCVLKEKNASDGLTDIMVRAEDAAKISRIIERFDLATVDMASVRRDIERDNGDIPSEQPMTEDETEALMDELFSSNQEEAPENPTEAQTPEPPRSEPTLNPAEADGTDIFNGYYFEIQRDMEDFYDRLSSYASGEDPWHDEEDIVIPSWDERENANYWQSAPLSNNEAKQNTSDIEALTKDEWNVPDTAEGSRPSVKQALADIKSELNKASSSKAQPSKTAERLPIPNKSFEERGRQ